MSQAWSCLQEQELSPRRIKGKILQSRVVPSLYIEAYTQYPKWVNPNAELSSEQVSTILKVLSLKTIFQPLSFVSVMLLQKLVHDTSRT